MTRSQRRRVVFAFFIFVVAEIALLAYGLLSYQPSRGIERPFRSRLENCP